MENLLNAVGNYGFPILVSVYLLVRIESKLDQLTKSICELRDAIMTATGGQVNCPGIFLK
ncbi:MAG: YvrJ family protein [Syntrophomonadales bacterium]